LRLDSFPMSPTESLQGSCGHQDISERDHCMHVSLEPGHTRIPAESLDAATNSGYFWLDIERTEADWYRDAAQWLDSHLRDHHLV